MKKLIIAAVIFASCGHVQTNQEEGTRELYISGMHYIVLNYSANGGMAILNVTKDSLEVESLKQVLDTTTEK